MVLSGYPVILVGFSAVFPSYLPNPPPPSHLPNGIWIGMNVNVVQQPAKDETSSFKIEWVTAIFEGQGLAKSLLAWAAGRHLSGWLAAILVATISEIIFSLFSPFLLFFFLSLSSTFHIEGEGLLGSKNSFSEPPCRDSCVFSKKRTFSQGRLN